MIVAIWWRSVRSEVRVVVIRRDQPDFVVTKVVEEFGVLLFIDFARPNDFLRVDVRTVENPIVVNVVIFAVTHHHQMFAWQCFEFSLNDLPADVALAGPVKGVALLAHDGSGGVSEKQ